MSKPTWIPGITANIIKRVMERTPGQIIDWSNEIEKGVNAAVEEAQARIVELEAQLKEVTQQRDAYLDAINRTNSNILAAVVRGTVGRAEKAEAEAKAADARASHWREAANHWCEAALKYYPMNGWAFDPTFPEAVISNIVAYHEQKCDEVKAQLAEARQLLKLVQALTINGDREAVEEIRAVLASETKEEK